MYYLCITLSAFFFFFFDELDNYRDPQGEFKNQLLAVSEIQIETPIAIMRMPRKDRKVNLVDSPMALLVMAVKMKLTAFVTGIVMDMLVRPNKKKKRTDPS